MFVGFVWFLISCLCVIESRAVFGYVIFRGGKPGRLVFLELRVRVSGLYSFCFLGLNLSGFRVFCLGLVGVREVFCGDFERINDRGVEGLIFRGFCRVFH